MADLFVYGTLQLPDVVERVLGRRLESAPARLHEHVRRTVRGRTYPGAAPAPGESVEGVLLLDLDEEALATFDRYECEPYVRRAARVTAEGSERDAFVYVVPLGHLSDEHWDLAEFERDHLAAFLADYEGFGRSS